MQETKTENKNTIDNKINFLNKTWRPTLSWTIVISVLIAYVIFPIVQLIFKLVWNIDIVFPDNILNGINYMLVTGGILAGVRTLEKKFGVTDIH